MTTIKIAHLYYDLMNLYGENGNLRVLKKHLENQNIKVNIYFLTIDDEIDFEKYDIFYIGCGSNNSFKQVLTDIIKYKNSIKKALNQNKFFIVTGNALNLFGSNFKNNMGEENSCLNILNFESEQISFRIVGEQIVKMNNLPNPLIGFQNRDSILKNIKELYLFEIIEGTGFYPKSNNEGIQYKNFYGSYLLGPILARNPHFTEFIVKNILEFHNLSYKKVANKLEEKAYQEYLAFYNQTKK